MQEKKKDGSTKEVTNVFPLLKIGLNLSSKFCLFVFVFVFFFLFFFLFFVVVFYRQL